jgi:hypothetical protein
VVISPLEYFDTIIKLIFWKKLACGGVENEKQKRRN